METAKAEAIERAVEALANKATAAATAHESMQFAQAALNLAHASATLHAIAEARQVSR